MRASARCDQTVPRSFKTCSGDLVRRRQHQAYVLLWSQTRAPKFNTLSRSRDIQDHWPAASVAILGGWPVSASAHSDANSPPIRVLKRGSGPFLKLARVISEDDVETHRSFLYFYQPPNRAAPRVIDRAPGPHPVETACFGRGGLFSFWIKGSLRPEGSRSSQTLAIRPYSVTGKIIGECPRS
jgi:hypothetical protein